MVILEISRALLDHMAKWHLGCRALGDTVAKQRRSVRAHRNELQ